MNWNIVLPIAMAILLVIVIVAIFQRAFRVVIAAVFLSIAIPVGVAIMSGDGADYISRFASLFTPAIEQQINDGYHDFSVTEKENPVLDKEATQDAFAQLWDMAKDKVHKGLPTP